LTETGVLPGTCGFPAGGGRRVGRSFSSPVARRGRWRCCLGDLEWCRTGGGWDVGEPVDQLADCVVVGFDRGAFVVGERDLNEHPLQPALRFEQLRSAGGFRDVEVAACARHPVRALLEEAVGAVAVAEVVELKWPAVAGLAVGDRVAIEEYLDRADVSREVPASV
jgi:hypothetical protein